MRDSPPPLTLIIIKVGQDYLSEDDKEVRKYIGQILEGKVRMPYKKIKRNRK